MTIQLCDSVNDTTCFWKHIKSMNSKGNVIDKSEITGSVWNNYFKELLNNDVNIDEDFKIMTDDFVRQHNELCNACDNNTVDFLNDEICRIEIFKAIDFLINGKAAGNDGIVGEMLKISKYVLIPHLFILFNNILETGIYPNGWCEAILCPLHKNGSVNEVGNYRGISLLLGGGPRVVVSTAAFHARARGSVPGPGGLKETKMFLPHPRVKVSIVGSLRDL